MVNFSEPVVAPRNRQEQEDRAELEAALRSGEFSSAIGWVVSLGKRLEGDIESIEDFTTNLQEEVGISDNAREICGWSVLYYFTTQVSSESQYKESMLLMYCDKTPCRS